MDRLSAFRVLVCLWFISGVVRTEEKSPARVVPPLLASHQELQEWLDSPELRVLDARARADYDRGHIPGAVWVDIKSAEKLAARPDGLKDREAWQAWITPLGITSNSRVLVYDGNRQLDAARTWWLLRYLGLDRVGLIDGSFQLWQASGRPVSTEIPAVKPGAWTVKFRTDRLATRDEVLRAVEAGSARIIDARSGPEYTGKLKQSARAGHIPTACHLEWSNQVDRDGRFVKPDELASRLKEKGVREGESLISHCQGGGRASVNAFALERLGIPTRNYYLGWSDWGNARETPVEKP